MTGGVRSDGVKTRSTKSGPGRCTVSFGIPLQTWLSSLSASAPSSLTMSVSPADFTAATADMAGLPEYGGGVYFPGGRGRDGGPFNEPIRGGEKKNKNYFPSETKKNNPRAD